MLGDAIQQGLTQDDYSVTGAVLVIGTLALLQVFTSVLSFHFKRLRPILEGEPIIVVEDGEPLEKNLRRERLTIEEIAAQARLQQIERLSDVKWAVLETSGQISFIKKSGSRAGRAAPRRRGPRRRGLPRARNRARLPERRSSRVRPPSPRA